MPLQNSRSWRGVTAIRVRPTPTCSGKAPSAKWGCIFLHICHICMHFIFKFYIFLCIYSDMNLNIQAKERVRCIFASHFVLTQIYGASSSPPGGPGPGQHSVELPVDRHGRSSPAVNGTVTPSHRHSGSLTFAKTPDYRDRDSVTGSLALPPPQWWQQTVNSTRMPAGWRLLAATWTRTA